MNIFLSPVLSPFTSSISRLKIQLKHLKLNLLIPHSTCKLNSNKIDTTPRQETSSNGFHYVNAHAIFFSLHPLYLHSAAVDCCLRVTNWKYRQKISPDTWMEVSRILYAQQKTGEFPHSRAAAQQAPPPFVCYIVAIHSTHTIEMSIVVLNSFVLSPCLYIRR